MNTASVDYFSSKSASSMYFKFPPHSHLSVKSSGDSPGGHSNSHIYRKQD